MNTKRILLIDDNPDFGGHQVMTAYGLEGLMHFGDWEVRALLHPTNDKNRQRWESIREQHGEGRLEVAEAATRSAKFQAVRSFFQSSAIAALRAQIEAFAPDVVLVSQGNIEQCSAVFRLKGKVDCPIVSYIPVPHTHAEMGAKLGALRDLTCRHLYDGADGFVTISETLGQMLKDYGTKGRVQIVENGIPLDRFDRQPSKAEAREQFNLPVDGFIWGQIGRTEYMQKGQDFSLALFLERSRADEHLVFLGSGPDSETLAAAASTHANVHCLPWTDNPAPLYAAIDGLLMPSRYEGVPLAMLEALANEVPVASTDRDGMRDWLPESWRFTYRDTSSALTAMDAIRQSPQETIQALKKKVLEGYSVAAFQEAFNAALEEWVCL